MRNYVTCKEKGVTIRTVAEEKYFLTTHNVTHQKTFLFFSDQNGAAENVVYFLCVFVSFLLVFKKDLIIKSMII